MLPSPLSQKDFVVVNNARKQGCCPSLYQEYILPKYKICGARVEKASSGFKMIGIGAALIIAGLVLLIAVDGAIRFVGIIGLIIGALLLLTPFCLVRYVTHLEMMTDPDDDMAKPVFFELRTIRKPDDDFILLYVYGSLMGAMPGYHALSHLIDDSLVQKVSPLEMTGIQVDKDKVPDSGLMAVSNDKTDTNEGFGKQLYVVNEQAGLFGEECGPLYKCGSSIAKFSTKAIFCEHLLIVQTEKKLLCYPQSYEKIVIPKYKISSVEFRKGGAGKALQATLSCLAQAGLILIIIGVVVAQLSAFGAATGGSIGSGSGSTWGYPPPSPAPPPSGTSGCATLGLCSRPPSPPPLLSPPGPPPPFPPPPPADQSAPWIIGGAILFVIAFLLIIMSCFFSMFTVDLILLQKPLVATGNPFKDFQAKLAKSMAGPMFHSLTVKSEPNKDFIMSYVYGTLGKNMGGYHALTHLIKDNLVDKVRPFTINGAITATGCGSFTPGSVVSTTTSS